MRVIVEWQDQLFGAPSECEALGEHEGKKYLLYLRWRSLDPWRGFIIDIKQTRKSFKEGKLSPDLFKKYDCFFRENDDLDKIKSALITCADRWLKESSR
jgi:hypothetical protein